MKKRYIIHNLSRHLYAAYGEMLNGLNNAQRFKSKKEAKSAMGCDFWSDNDGDIFSIETIYTND